MNTKHEIAMQLLGACLIINDLGECHAHYDYAPHTNAVYIYVVGSETEYDGTVPPRLADVVVYLNYDSAEQDCADAIKKLKEFM